MSAPHKCPVCEGTGEVKRARVGQENPFKLHVDWDSHTCPACKGACVLWEPGSQAFPPPPAEWEKDWQDRFAKLFEHDEEARLAALRSKLGRKKE